MAEKDRETTSNDGEQRWRVAATATELSMEM